MKRFKTQDNEHEYHFGVCTKAENANNKSDGFIQINIEKKKQFVIGRLDDVDIEGFGSFYFLHLLFIYYSFITHLLYILISSRTKYKYFNFKFIKQNQNKQKKR